MRVGIPNFPTSKDRWAYLLAEYKYIIAVFSGAGAIATIHYGWIEIPDWAAATATAAIVFGVLGYPIALRIVGWLYDPNHVEVYEINAVNDAVRKWLVPPDVWREKKVREVDPYAINGGQSWAVREFEWREDVEQLEVRGVWLEEVEDHRLITSKAYMEDIHNTLIEKFIEYARVRGRISRMGAEIQEGTIQEMSEAAEDVTMLDRDIVMDAYEDATQSADPSTDDLPTISEEDLPEHETPSPENHPGHDIEDASIED